MTTALLLVADREPLAWPLREERSTGAEEAGVVSSDERYAAVALHHTQLRSISGTPPWSSHGYCKSNECAGGSGGGRAFRDREFEVGFRVHIDGLAPPHDGVELGPLAGRLDALPDPATWSVRMRRTLIPLSERDALLIGDLLEPKLRRRRDVLSDYLTACKATATAIGGVA
jgi:hypothetical protein